MIAPLAALLRLHEMTESSGLDPENNQQARLLQAINATAMRKYAIANRRFGAGSVVPMDRGVCSGCYMVQPASLPELDEDIHQCTHCGRLIYDTDVAYELSVG